MSIRRRGAFALVAGLAGVLAAGCASVKAPEQRMTAALPAISCAKEPEACKQLPPALEATEQFRVNVLTVIGACKEGACRPKVKPFDAETQEIVFQRTLKYALDICVPVNCGDVVPPADTPQRQEYDECVRRCSGTQ